MQQALDAAPTAAPGSPLSPDRPRRPNPRRHTARPARRLHASPGQDPRAGGLVVRVALVLGATVMIIGTVPLAWRAGLSLDEATTGVIAEATVQGFGGAVGGAGIGTVLMPSLR